MLLEAESLTALRAWEGSQVAVDVEMTVQTVAPLKAPTTLETHMGSGLVGSMPESVVQQEGRRRARPAAHLKITKICHF